MIGKEVLLNLDEEEGSRLKKRNKGRHTPGPQGMHSARL